MFLKFLKSETKRLIKQKGFYFLVILLIASSITLNIYYRTKDKTGENYSVYGIAEYGNLTELKVNLDLATTSYSLYYDSFQQAVKDKMLTKDQIEIKEKELKHLKREVNILEYLNNNQILYEDISQYNLFNESSANSIVNYSINIVTIIISVIVVIKLAITIPSELKENQAKLSLTLPISRTKYLIFKYLVIFIQAIILMLFYCVFLMLSAYIIYPSTGVLLFATDTNIFGLSLFVQVFFQYIFSTISIFGFSIFAFSISLLILKKISSLFISLFICFGQSIIKMIEIIFFKDLRKYSKFFISNNFYVQDYYSDLESLPIYLSLLVLITNILIISSTGFVRFNKMDIMN